MNDHREKEPTHTHTRTHKQISRNVDEMVKIPAKLIRHLLLDDFSRRVGFKRAMNNKYISLDKFTSNQGWITLYHSQI